MGVGWGNGINNMEKKYAGPIPYIHLTYFGFSINFGKNNHIFLGGELGAIPFKGLINFHGGYRF
jgi:hypothetical protein